MIYGPDEDPVLDTPEQMQRAYNRHQSNRRTEAFEAGVNHAKKDDPYYGVPGTVEGPDYDYEKQWSQRDHD